MAILDEKSETSELSRIANESGLAIALVDENSREVEVFNNNSICQTINSRGQFSPECSRFCGEALKRSFSAKRTIGFECHAGLECRAVPIKGDRPLVAIVGRTFVKAENYRSATERSIMGNWQQHPAQELFDNVLLTASTEALDQAARKIEHLRPLGIKDVAATLKDQVRVMGKKPERVEIRKTPGQKVPGIVERFNREVGLDPRFEHPRGKSEPEPSVAERSPIEPLVKSSSEPSVSSAQLQEIDPEKTGDSALRSQEWRSFFSSITRTDYAKAVSMILDFLCTQYGLSGAIWLESSDEKFESFATVGDLKNRRIHLGVQPTDEKLLDAARNGLPLILAKNDQVQRQKDERKLHLFAIGANDEVSAAIAIFEPEIDEPKKRQIARICRAIASQLELLKLRDQVASGESIAHAVRRFSSSLRRIDADDFWLDVTQCAAEILRAERVSLMIFDERSDTLIIKAMVGAQADNFPENDIGQRASRVIFDRGDPVLVSNVSKTRLPPSPVNRGYKTPSFLICPIVLAGKKLGVINFADRACGLSFDKSSLELFDAIAPQLAVAIDRAILKGKAGEFEQLSVTDSLTGLLNRRYIEARLAEEIKRSNRHGFPMSFMMLDVDRFKSYNDQFGHPAGDEALKLVGNVIRETLRSADVAARFGGEEFCILLPQTTSEEALIIAERIRQNIEQANFRHRPVTASIGVASCSAELCVSADLVSAADKALYAAKEQGRNRVLTFESIDR